MNLHPRVGGPFVKKHFEHTKLKFQLWSFKTRGTFSLKVLFNFEKIESFLVVVFILIVELIRLIL